MFGRRKIEYKTDEQLRGMVRAGVVTSRALDAAVAAAGIETVLVTARPPRWLHDLAHVVGERGKFDARTGRAIVAFRKLTGLERTSEADTTVLFETGPQGLPLLAEVAERCGRRMDHVGQDDRDFAIIRLHL